MESNNETLQEKTGYDGPLPMEPEQRAEAGKCIGFMRIVLFEEAMICDGEFPGSNMMAAIAQLMTRSEYMATTFQKAVSLFEFAQATPLGGMVINRMMTSKKPAGFTVKEHYEGDTAGGVKHKSSSVTKMPDNQAENSTPPPNQEE